MQCRFSALLLVLVRRKRLRLVFRGFPTGGSALRTSKRIGRARSFQGSNVLRSRVAVMVCGDFAVQPGTVTQLLTTHQTFQQ